MNIFEDIKRLDPDGVEYWSSRDLAKALEYTDYRNFEEVVAKARIACKNSRQPEEDHFVDVNEMVPLGSGAERQIKSVFLSRYACYLIIQNADPRKEVVALGHSYFAMQTRRQEMEDDRRLQLRQEMKEHNKQLASAAKQAGVIEPIDYAIFQNAGYQGLYGGLMKQDIHRRKGLKKSQDILDHNMINATTTFSIRMDSGVKEQLDEFCSAVGMNTNTAVNMFARAVIREKRLPFDVTTSADPFYSDSNVTYLREAIAALNAGKGVEHELIESDDEENLV